MGTRGMTTPTGRTTPPTPPAPSRWAITAARAVPLVVLPSSLWRVALGLGVPVGFSGALARTYAAPGWITPYVLGLSLLAEALALLTLGLVRPWGERVPSRIPLLGGRTIPAPAAAVPAGLGAVALTTLTIAGAAVWNGPQNNGQPDAPHGIAGLVMAACYAPLLAWGPLLGAVTVAYYRRRQGGPSIRP
jgi:hypothetical protein